MSMLWAEITPAIQDVHAYEIGWGTLSLINAGLAQAKLRSGLGWWFVSIFIGPIATLLIVILPTKAFGSQQSPPPEHFARQR